MPGQKSQNSEADLHIKCSKYRKKFPLSLDFLDHFRLKRTDALWAMWWPHERRCFVERLRAEWPGSSVSVLTVETRCWRVIRTWSRGEACMSAPLQGRLRKGTMSRLCSKSCCRNPLCTFYSAILGWWSPQLMCGRYTLTTRSMRRKITKSVFPTQKYSHTLRSLTYYDTHAHTHRHTQTQAHSQLQTHSDTHSYSHSVTDSQLGVVILCVTDIHTFSYKHKEKTSCHSLSHIHMHPGYITRSIVVAIHVWLTSILDRHFYSPRSFIQEQSNLWLC